MTNNIILHMSLIQLELSEAPSTRVKIATRLCESRGTLGRKCVQL